MTNKKPARPNPRRKPVDDSSFQSRVDYVAKALKRGSWGKRFDACFEHHDNEHMIAIVMHRAERNDELKQAIMSCFSVSDWSDVPWQEAARKFAGLSSRDIRLLAEAHSQEMIKKFNLMYQQPTLLLEG